MFQISVYKCSYITEENVKLFIPVFAQSACHNTVRQAVVDKAQTDPVTPQLLLAHSWNYPLTVHEHLVAYPTINNKQNIKAHKQNRKSC